MQQELGSSINIFHICVNTYKKTVSFKYKEKYMYINECNI